MVGYFLPIQDSGGWLIRQEPGNPLRWQLLLLGPGDKTTVVNSFEFPHLAAHALVTFQTGNPDWDSIPKVAPAMAPQLAERNLHDLKNWTRREIP